MTPFMNPKPVHTLIQVTIFSQFFVTYVPGDNGYLYPTVAHGRKAVLSEDGGRARLQNVLHYFFGTI
jgi:hypothetical protein